MSNQISPVDLETVTAGATITGTGACDPILQTLTTLQSTIQNIGNTANQTGFSTTDVLLLSLLLSQQRPAGVFVRQPFWW